MKTTILMMLYSCIAFAQTFVKTTSAEALLVPRGTLVHIWDKPYTKIVANISKNQKQIVRLRYEIVLEKRGGIHILSMPNMRKKVWINGVELKDSVQFEVYTSKNIYKRCWNSQRNTEV
jgi:hypothetical protein